jgi:hypothetical protein
MNLRQAGGSFRDGITQGLGGKQILVHDLRAMSSSYFNRISNANHKGRSRMRRRELMCAERRYSSSP